MTQDELKALAEKIQKGKAEGRDTDDDELLLLDELNKGVDEIIALAETMPDVES